MQFLNAVIPATEEEAILFAELTTLVYGVMVHVVEEVIRVVVVVVVIFLIQIKGARFHRTSSPLDKR